MERILDIVDSLAHQKGLDPSLTRDALKNALIKTAKMVVGEELEFDTQIDEENKKVTLFQKIEVVAEEDERLQDEEEKEKIMTLQAAQELDPDLEVGDAVEYELSLESFGRTAAMTLQRELDYELQRLLEDQIYNHYKDKVGKLASGTVTRVDGEENTYIEMDEVRAMLPKKNRIKGERFKVGHTIKCIVRRVTINKREGIRIELSRTTPKFLEELLALEVPEIGDGSVVVEKAARIPGERAKVALSSHKPNVDAVGATVGVKGVRINAVSEELCGESIDVISFSPVPEIFISRAMSPAIVNNVICDKEEMRATVTINSDQKAKAIGKSGINIRLASMLTGYEIDLKEVETGMSMGAAGEKKEDEKTGDTSLLSSLFND